MAAQPDAANGSGGQGQACVGLRSAEASTDGLGSGETGIDGLRFAESGDAGAAQRYAWLENLLPPVEEVRPGLWSIPVPWPGSGLRYTLSYLVAGRGGPALIDTGWPTDEGWDALADRVAQTGHDLTEIRYVLVTHAHADHLGMAGRVREASGALVGMHPAESTVLLHRVGLQTWRERLSGWLGARGAPDDQRAEISELMSGAVAFHARLARADFAVEDGGLPLGAGTGLRAVWTPGHTPGHLCFYDERNDVLLTGDHVLPRITPHIGLPPGAEGDPLGDYEASLRALARYNPAEVLPAHEYRFADLGARLEALLSHHRTRLAEVEHAVANDPGLSTWAVAEALTWSRGWEQTQGGARHSAISETWAHLVHLQGRQRVINHGRERDSWTPGPRCSAAD
ncbi:MAG TPA: MBL fold metallo-hydrolase [Streptosporangiaceae bacterium]|nr:MBL fold metallo-hydrolase [Streptosporangiaceae bacterium]